MFTGRISFDEVDKREPLPAPPGALAINREISNRLECLICDSMASCIGPAFLQNWHEILRLFEQYQCEIIDASKLRQTCGKGCLACCGHWVDDVFSFEAEILAGYLCKHHSGEIPSIIDRCREDTALLDQLNSLVKQRLSSSTEDQADPIDARDLLLSTFYQMQRPCPLLKNNECIVYDVRPLTCRRYASFSDARYCDPDQINDAPAATYLFGFEDETEALLEKLHEKHRKFEGEGGLRAILTGYLDV